MLELDAVETGRRSARPSWDATPLPLTARMDERLRALSGQRELLLTLSDAFGSPLNIVLPEAVRENAERFGAVFRREGVLGKIYFAHKPNKSVAVLEELADTEHGIDVASLAELRQALSRGVRGERLEVTGPKNPELITLALRHGVLLNIDSDAELGTVIALARALGRGPAPILLRLNGFSAAYARTEPRDTQFGTHIDRVGELFEAVEGARDAVTLRGFSCHLSAAREIDRVAAAEALIDLVLTAAERGHPADIVNLGGGFHVNYLDSAEEWTAYLSSVKASAFGGPSLGWNRSALGFRVENGALRGAPFFHEHHVPVAGPDELARLLRAPLPRFDGQPLGRTLNDMMLTLWIEPGRSLLDQAGATLARVVALKHSQYGEPILSMDMNRTNLSSVDLELMVDPLVISRGNAVTPDEPIGCFLTGNLCLFSDIIMRHRVFMNIVPAAGDVLFFPNTAGYNMDFAEARPLQQRTAEKIAVRMNGDGLRWFLDAEYKTSRIERVLTSQSLNTNW